MALRSAQTKLATFVRAGVLCLVAGGPTCIAHGLPETPDSISLMFKAEAASCTVGVFLQSWDATMVAFVSSHAAVASAYVRIAVEHSLIR